MRLPKRELLNNCKDSKGIEPLIDLADSVIRTRQPNWSPFLAAPLREEALRVMNPLHDLYWLAEGGYPGAERQRLQCLHTSSENILTKGKHPIAGIRIEGNFLFDKARPNDFRESLKISGIPPGELGDIWIVNDRGAQALCTPEASLAIDGKSGMLREVQIFYEAVDISKLQLPPQRAKKRFVSIEASRRIDAIASAGFGLSRAKIANQIESGRLRLNWKAINQSSKEIHTGDRMQLENKGSIEVLSLELTKRQRWRVELLRM